METVTEAQWWNPIYLLGTFMASPTLGKRASAMLIDLILVSALQYWLCLVFGVYQPMAFGGDNALINGDGVVLYVGQAPTLAYVWLAIIVILYFTFFEALFGATPGKGLLRLQVVNLDGGRPSVRALLTRNVFRLVDALPLWYIVGALVVRSTIHEQRVGDIIAGTTVVPRAQVASGESGFSGIVRMLLKWLLVVVMLALLVSGGIAFQYFERPPLIIQSWANANNSVGGYPTTTAENCGPTPAWPTDNEVVAHPITEYAIGAPVWSNGQVTYPVLVDVWDSATSGGRPPTTPMQVSLSQINPGPDLFDGHIRFTDFNPLNGGWRIAGGDMMSPPGC